MATLFEVQGDYASARPLFERALAIHEATLGPLHPKTAAILNNLGNLLRMQGDYASACPFLERALVIRDMVLGSQHPDTAASLNNLGNLLRDYVSARSLLERGLVVREAILGSQHPDTAASLMSLVGLLKTKGDYAAARLLAERALAIHTATLGPEHPDTARSLDVLGAVFETLGDYAAAYPLYERALQIRESVLGAQHPDVANSLDALGTLSITLTDYVAAQAFLERALQIRESVLSPQHPDTASSLHALADLLYRQGQYAAARSLFERMLALCEATLGPNHPKTAQALTSLGVLLRIQGYTSAAQALYERALTVSFGSHHVHVAAILNNLAVLYAHLGKFDLALPFISRALVIYDSSLGSHHPDTIATQQDLAAMHQSMAYDTLPPDIQVAIATSDQVAVSAALDAVPDNQHAAVRDTLTKLGIFAATEPADEMTALLTNTHTAVGLALADDWVDRADLRAHFLQTIAEIEAQTSNDSLSRLIAQRLYDLITKLDAAPPLPVRTTEERAADAIADIDARVASAFADPTVDRAVLMAYLDERAAYFANGEAEGSPWLAVAARCRALAAQVAARAG